MLVVVVVLSFVGYDYYTRHKDLPLVEFPAYRSKGNPQAPLKIAEFLDYTCYECALGSILLKAYFAEHPKDIYYGVKYFPMGELNSTVGAVYSECAGRQNKFWEFHDLLFAKQEDWRTMLKIKPPLVKLAQEAGLDLTKLDQCVQDRGVKHLIEKEKEFGESRMVQSTPTYFVNGETIVGPAGLERRLSQYFIDPRKTHKIK